MWLNKWVNFSKQALLTTSNKIIVITKKYIYIIIQYKEFSFHHLGIHELLKVSNLFPENWILIVYLYNEIRIIENIVDRFNFQVIWYTYCITTISNNFSYFYIPPFFVIRNSNYYYFQVSSLPTNWSIRRERNFRYLP